MARIKDITFESGSLTGTNGADSAQGTVSLDSASAMKGTYSARADALGDFVREDFTGVDTVYVSTLVKFTSLPASTQSRNILIRDSLNNLVASLRVTSAGKVQLRDGSNTQVGSDSSLTISTDTIYRLGIRRTKSTASNGVLEAYAVTDGDAWGSPFASTSADGSTNQTTRVEVGLTTAGTVADLFVDNIRIDDASIPTDDVAGGTTYNQSVNVTVTVTASVTKQINKLMFFSSVSVVTINKQTAKTINIAVSNAVAVVKGVGKSISLSVSNVVSTAKEVGKSISATVSNAVSLVKGVGKIIPVDVSSLVSIIKQIDISIPITVNNEVSVNKQVGKIIPIVVNNVVPAVIKQVNKNVDVIASTAVSITKQISKTLNFTTAANVVIQYGQLFFRTIDITVATSVNMQKTIGKRINVAVSTVVTLLRSVSGAIAELGRNIGIFSIKEKDAGTQSLTSIDSKTISIDPDNTEG